jgi:alkanesulfonate monooxygenase SsuD/methylene tetrahydromethanopterin reductase-like flavin-dependent oxidoreductase (luciferase family)
VLSKVTFGVFLPFYALKTEKSASTSFSQIRDVVVECEQSGYHSVWLDDHLMFKQNPILESWTTLSALSSITTGIRLGIMVTSNAFRNPGVLAKMASTVDIISNGRLEFGIGAGVQKEEHIAYGFTFPEPQVRIERMKETVEIVKKLWTQEKTTYEGDHYHLSDATFEPKPLQKPHPPITIGGSGEKHLLKVTAQLAVRCDFGYLPSLEQYKYKLHVLEKYCDVANRNFGKIEKSYWPASQIIIAPNQEELDKKVQRLKPKTVSSEDFEKNTLVGTPDVCIAKLQPCLDLGVNHFMLFFGELPETSGLKLFARIVAKKLESTN